MSRPDLANPEQEPLAALRDAGRSIAKAQTVLVRILPIVLTMFLGCLTVGIPLPVLPLHVQGALGFGTLATGVVIGIQSLAALLMRAPAGNLTDARGGKFALQVGLLLASVSGVIYLFSLMILGHSVLSLSALLAGRAVLGGAESLIATGALTWAIGIVGVELSGRAMAWVGIAIYGALAVGAPIGMMLNSYHGFAALSLCVIALPVVGLLTAAFGIATPIPVGKRLPFYKVLGLVAWPGAGLALATMGFGSIAAFMTLYFASRGWHGGGAAMSVFGGAYIGARLLLGGLPDRIGGAKVAIYFLVIEGVGQLLIGLSAVPAAALVGAALTGIGFSLVFPAFGIETVKRAPLQNRGAALAAYAAFFDIGVGIAGPLTGIVVDGFGYSAAYMCSALSIFGAILIAFRLRARKS